MSHKTFRTLKECRMNGEKVKDEINFYIYNKKKREGSNEKDWSANERMMKTTTTNEWTPKSAPLKFSLTQSLSHDTLIVHSFDTFIRWRVSWLNLIECVEKSYQWVGRRHNAVCGYTHEGKQIHTHIAVREKININWRPRHPTNGT